MLLLRAEKIIVEVAGPQSRFLRLMSWDFANRMISILIGLGICFLLAVSLFGLLHSH